MSAIEKSTNVEGVEDEAVGAAIGAQKYVIVAAPAGRTLLHRAGLRHAVAIREPLDAPSAAALVKAGAKRICLLTDRGAPTDYITPEALVNCLIEGIAVTVFETTHSSHTLAQLAATDTWALEAASGELDRRFAQAPELVEWWCRLGWRDEVGSLDVVSRSRFVERTAAPVLVFLNAAAREALAGLLADSLELPKRGVLQVVEALAKGAPLSRGRR